MFFKIKRMINIADHIIIEKILQSEIDKVTCLLADTFYTNPAYSAIFKNKKRLKEGLLWLFRANLIIYNHKHPLTMVIKEKSSGEIIGTFSIVPPPGIKKNIRVYAKIKIGNFISKFGINTLIRMLSLDAKNKEILTGSMGNSEYYYLSMVAIKQEYRGKGLGSFVIKKAINELISSKPSCRLIGLTTQLPENVVFYSRLGFCKLDEGYVCFRENKYYNCNMKFDIPYEV